MHNRAAIAAIAPRSLINFYKGKIDALLGVGNVPSLKFKAICFALLRRRPCTCQYCAILFALIFVAGTISSYLEIFVFCHQYFHLPLLCCCSGPCCLSKYRPKNASRLGYCQLLPQYIS